MSVPGSILPSKYRTLQDRLAFWASKGVQFVDTNGLINLDHAGSNVIVYPVFGLNKFYDKDSALGTFLDLYYNPILDTYQTLNYYTTRLAAHRIPGSDDPLELNNYEYRYYTVSTNFFSSVKSLSNVPPYPNDISTFNESSSTYSFTNLIGKTFYFTEAGNGLKTVTQEAVKGAGDTIKETIETGVKYEYAILLPFVAILLLIFLIK